MRRLYGARHGLLRWTMRRHSTQTLCGPRQVQNLKNAEPETVFRNEIPFFMVMLTKSSKIWRGFILRGKIFRYNECSDEKLLYCSGLAPQLVP
jgi:hypothetical protein